VQLLLGELITLYPRMMVLILFLDEQRKKSGNFYQERFKMIYKKVNFQEFDFIAKREDEIIIELTNVVEKSLSYDGIQKLVDNIECLLKYERMKAILGGGDSKYWQ
jgi:hypothetical protein